MQSNFAHRELGYAPQHSAPVQFQFSLAALLAFVTVLSVCFSSIATCGAVGILVSVPAAVAAMAAMSGADCRTLRRICLVTALCGTVPLGLMALASYPIIVIADSDLGVGAMARVADWTYLCEECFAVAVVTALGNGTRRTKVRLALALLLLFLVITQQTESTDTPAAARMALASLIGILIAADGLPALERLFQWRSPLINCVWMLAVPALVLLTDWNARYYLFADERELVNRWDVAPSFVPLFVLLALCVVVLAWISQHDHQTRN
jgi:hypothetical protein